jgi:hypothetical protein
VTDLPVIEYHAVDRLPCDAVAMTETVDGRVDVFLSEAYPLDVVAHHMTELLRAWREVNIDVPVRIAV